MTVAGTARSGASARGSRSTSTNAGTAAGRISQDPASRFTTTNVVSSPTLPAKEDAVDSCGLEMLKDIHVEDSTHQKA